MEESGVLRTTNNSITANCSNNSNSTSYSGSGSGRGSRVIGNSSEPRKVYCPQCKTLLIEPLSCAIYRCCNCSQLLIAKHALRKSLSTGSVLPSTENQEKDEERSSVDGQSPEIPPPARQLHHDHDGTVYNEADEEEVPDFDPDISNSKVRQSPDSVLHTSPPPSNPISTQDQYNATASAAPAECSVSTQIKETHDDDSSLTKDGTFSDREKYIRDDSFHFNVPAADLSSSEQMDMVALSSTESGILHRPLECKEADALDRVESEEDCVSREVSFDDWNQHGTLRTSPQQLEDSMGSIAILEEENEEDEGTDCDTNDEDEIEDEDENEDQDDDEDNKVITKVNDADDDDGFLDRIQEPIAFPILSAMGGDLESLDTPLEGAGYGLEAQLEMEKISPEVDSPHFHLEHESDAEEAIPESSVNTTPWNSPPKVLSVIAPELDVDELSSNSFKGTGADNSVLPSKDSGNFLFNVRSEPEGNSAEEESNINQPKESSNKAKISSEPQISNGRDKEEFISPDAEPRNIHRFDLEMNAKKGDINGSSLPCQTQQSLNLNTFAIRGGYIDSTNYHIHNGLPLIQQHPANNLSEGGGFTFRIDSEPGSSAEKPNNNKGNQPNEYQSKPQILNHQVEEELVSPDEAKPEDIYSSGRYLATNTIMGDINGSLPLNPHKRLNLNPPQIGGIDHLQNELPHIQQHPQRGRHRYSGEYHNGRPAAKLYPLPNKEPQLRGSREDLHFGGGVPFGQREEVIMTNSRDRNAYLDGFYHHRSSELNDGAVYHPNRLPVSNQAPQSYMPVLGFPTLPTTHPPHPHHHPLQYYPHQSSSICALCIPHQHHTAHEASHCQCTACISYLLSMQQQQQTAIIPPPLPQQQQQWPQYWHQAPLHHPDSSAWNLDSPAGKRLVEMCPKHRRRHYPRLPKTGAAPFVLCQRCFQLLQVPSRLSHLSGDIAIQKLRCGTCMKISKFSVVDGFEEDEMGSHRSAINNSRQEHLFMRSSSWLSHLNSDMLAPSSGHSSPTGSDRFRRTQQQPSRGGGRMLDNNPNHGICRKNAETSHMYANNAEELGSSSRASSTRGSFEIHPNPQMSRVSHASIQHASSSNRSNSRSKQVVSTMPPLPPAPQFQQDNIKGEKRPSLGHQVVAGSPLHELLGYKSPIDLCVLRARSIGASNRQQETDHSPRSSSSNHKNTTELGQNGIDGSHSARSTVEDGPYNSLPINRGGTASQRVLMDDPTIRRNKSLLGFLKKGITEISKGKQGPTKSNTTVMVNGNIIPEEAVKAAAERAGTIASGSYWYDFNAGFWGVMGGPCTGIIPPFIKEFQYPMPRDCAGGTTGILVNERELHEKDLNVLAKRKFPRTPGKAYTLDFSGKIVDETTGQELPSLGMLAPSIEERGRGYGMFQNQKS